MKFTYPNNSEIAILHNLVDAFAAEMKKKLEEAHRNGKRGWSNPEWSKAAIVERIYANSDPVDPVDIANYCAFLWNRQ